MPPHNGCTKKLLGGVCGCEAASTHPQSPQKHRLALRGRGSRLLQGLGDQLRVLHLEAGGAQPGGSLVVGSVGQAGGGEKYAQLTAFLISAVILASFSAFSSVRA
jgi:hypothetical protein